MPDFRASVSIVQRFGKVVIDNYNRRKREEQNTIDNFYNKNQNKVDISETLDNLSFTIPSEMNIYSNSIWTKSYRNNSLSCFVTIETPSVPENYNYNATTYLEIDKLSSYSCSDIMDANINNNIWNYEECVYENYGNRYDYYYYAILYNNTLYRIKFTINGDNDGSCLNMKEKVIGSLNLN